MRNIRVGNKLPFWARSGTQVHCNRLAAAIHTQLLEQVPDMELDGVKRNILVTGNLLVGATGRQIGKHLQFAAGEGGQGVIVYLSHIDVREDHAAVGNGFNTVQ